MKDHLGNVRTTFSDIKMPTISQTPPYNRNPPYSVDLLSKSEYYPYGMKINELSYNATGARYGYNGTHEQDKEVNADGNYIDFGNFGYDTRVSMRRNQEPLKAKYPHLSQYAIFANNPIRFSDPTGYDIFTDQEGWAIKEKGYIERIGRDHPFEYNSEFGLITLKENFDPAQYNEDKLSIILRENELIQSSVANIIIPVDRDERFFYNLRNKETSLDILDANATNDPIYDINGNLVANFIKIARDPAQTLWASGKIIGYRSTISEIGYTGLHETITHAYLYICNPELSDIDNNYESYKIDIQLRRYYPQELNWFENIFFGIFNSDYKKYMGGDNQHNKEEPKRYENENNP